MNPSLPWPGTNSEEVEEAQEVTEDFGVSEPPVPATEQNVPPSETSFQQGQPTSGAVVQSSTAGEPIAGVEQDSSQERLPATGKMPHPSSERQTISGAIPKKIGGASSDSKRLPKSPAIEIPKIKSPTESSAASKAFWEETGAIPKYLTKEYAEKAPKYLPPFKKPNAPKPKPKMEPPTKVPEKSEVPSSLTPESSQASSEPPKEPSPELRQEPPRERRSSRSERALFVRQHCLDFQDYKRTVNNKQKGLEQSLNLVLPKMNAAMVDAQKLAAKIEKVRSQVCDTEETLKTQNDKMKYLVGRTVGTISKIDGLFDRFRTDILDYTSLTTEGNDGIDTRLSKLLKILCGMEDEDLEKEENKVIRDAFSEEDNGSKE